MKVALIILITIIHSTGAYAQPYIDIFNTRYVASPGLGSKPHHNVLNYANISTTLPIKFQNEDALIFSPFVEKWTAQVHNEEPKQSYYGLCLPISYLKNLNGTNKTLVLTSIVRMNDEQIDSDGKMQFGAAAQLHIKKNEALTWKLGLYVNGDLFGLFVIPLAGIDWKIDEKSNLFGLLPANLTYERKLNSWFYYGATFRTFTNSYAKDTGYWRIDENQLGAFADLYLTKRIVFNLETGSSIMRKVRTGIDSKANEKWNMSDNIYFKISLAYRMRFR